MSAGFRVVVRDIPLGGDLPAFLARVSRRPLHAIVPAADARRTTRARREAERAERGYVSGWSVEAPDRALRGATPRLGLWLDQSSQTPAETVEAIGRRMWAEAVCA